MSCLLVRVAPLPMVALLTLANVLSAGDLRVDANIVTGIDVSDSVNEEQIDAQLEGLAQAVTSDRVLASVQSGSMGRIGFAVFLLHHQQILLVDWAEISNRADAEAVARAVTSRNASDITTEIWKSGTKYRLTDVSGAIEYGLNLVNRSPFSSEYFAINIVGNGVDNYGDQPRDATDAAVQSGGTVNAVVLENGDDKLQSYFWAEVVGGQGSFVLADEGEQTLTQMMKQKFAREVLLANSAN